MNKWNNFFMNVAISASMMSKDKSTKVGACIVKDKKIIGVGFNGPPKQINDDLVPELNSEILIDSKNTYMVHAEVNAILNSDLKECKGAEIYITTSPCTNCALVIAQSGIKKVYYLEEYHRKEITKAAFYLLKLCGVEIEKL